MVPWDRNTAPTAIYSWRRYWMMALRKLGNMTTSNGSWLPVERSVPADRWWWMSASGPLMVWFTYGFGWEANKHPKVLDGELGWAPGHLKTWNFSELRSGLQKAQTASMVDLPALSAYAERCGSVLLVPIIITFLRVTLVLFWWLRLFCPNFYFQKLKIKDTELNQVTVHLP